MIDMKTVVLDDDNEYYVIETIDIDNVTYKLFSNVDDEKDIKIRKIIVQDNEKFMVGIDDYNELNKVILEFDKKLNS